MKLLKSKSILYTLLSSSLILALNFGCGNAPRTASDVKFDAGYSTALDGVIAQGMILSTTSERWNIEQNINSQLMYSVGQLNGIGGVADMNRTIIAIDDIKSREDGLYIATYHAKLLVAWPTNVSRPESFELIVPSRGDTDGQWTLMQILAPNPESDRACMDWAAHDVTFGIFWYYYRPNQSSCAPRLAQATAQEAIFRLKMELAVSGENTTGKRPEYQKVWEDGRLVVTAIYGKAEAGATSNSDAGISAFQETYAQLLDVYGQPRQSNLRPGEYPDANHPTVKLIFQTPGGTLDIHLYLIEGIRSATPEFQRAYNERTQISDYVSYSGHSGLGANIRALARMGNFLKGQYQIYLVNGCDTFAYVDDALRSAHQLVNPNDGSNKYIDIITNAMPAYFHNLAESNMAVITALVGQDKTYREILTAIDPSQKAVVTGEEDNGLPFH